MRIRDIWNGDLAENGIFKNLTLPSPLNYSELNLEYFIKRQNKRVSGIVEYYAKENIEDLNAKIAGIINSHYAPIWERTAYALGIDYRPLENYSMVEQKEFEQDHIRDLTDNSRNTNTDNTQQENMKYAINSNSYTNESKTQNSGDVIQTGENIYTGKTTDRTIRDTLTRSGNIGVTTSQQMLESEINLRNKYILIEIIFKDVDKILTLGYN